MAAALSCAAHVFFRAVIVCRGVATIAALTLATVLLPGNTACAQVTTGTWTGGAGNVLWSSTNNWNPTISISTTGTYALTFSGTVGKSGDNVSVTNDVGSVTLTALNFANSGTLAPNQSAFFIVSGGTLNFSGGGQILTTAAAGTPFQVASDGDRILSQITISSGTTEIFANNNHNLTLGSGTGGGNISGNGTLRIDGLGSTTQYVYIGGSNSYTGGTLVDGAYAATGLRDANSSNNDAFGSGLVTVQHEGTLLLRNNSKITNALNVSGIGSGTVPANRGSLIGSFGVAGSTAEYAGTISVLGDTRFTTTSSAAGDQTSKMVISGDVNLNSFLLTLKSRKAVTSGTDGLLIEITGKVTGSGGIDVNGEGAYSRVKLSGSNGYTGGTTVTTGTLIVGNNSALGTGFLAVNTSGLDLNGFNASAGALFGTTSGTIQSNVAGAARLITNSTTSGTYAGVIRNGSGTVGYTKQGTGSQFLTGTSTYTGTTLVQGGSLYVNGQLGNTTTTVQSGGTLSGTGTILGDVTVQSGGTISPGADANQIGTLTMGSLTLESGATTAMSINNETAGTYDQLVSTGATTFGGALAIDMQYAGGTFKNDLTGSVWDLYTAGSFSGNLQSITMTGVYGTVVFTEVSGIPGRWESNYLGDGKEFAFFTSGVNAGKLFAVPEPSTLALAAAGGLCAFGLSRRRATRRTVG